MNPWYDVLLKLEKRIPDEDFSTWFKPARYVRHTAECLTISVPNNLFKSVIKERYFGDISSALSEIGLGSTAIAFVDSTDSHSADCDSNDDRADNRLYLNPRYTFDSFVIGKSNELAHAAAAATAEDPGRRYNPLFIYGGVGLGKTHLMQAVGNAAARRHPHLNIVYMSAESFMNELIYAIQFDGTSSFRSRYRNIDMLLIDDIQFLAGKERTQEEFFHTFNALHNASKQIIISSDSTPRDIPTIEERLRSRFGWGLIADIQPPELETKIAILRQKALEEGTELDEDVAMLIAGNVRSNIRELEGCLIRLVFYSSLTGRAIDLDFAKEALADHLSPQERSITIRDIQKKIAEYYNITEKELCSRNNASRVSFPRQVAMYLCKKLTQASLPEIGRQFGGKHHSTVLHSLRKIDRLLKSDSSMSHALETLSASLT